MSVQIHIIGGGVAVEITSYPDFELYRGAEWGKAEPTSEYADHIAAGGTEYDWDKEVTHELLEHEFPLLVLGTASVRRPNIDLLHTAADASDAIVKVTNGELSAWAEIIHAVYSEPVVEEDCAAITLTLTCRPEWLIPTKEDADTITAFPAVLTPPTIGGDKAARTEWAVVATQQTTMMALGVFPDATTGLALTQDYSGVADATALGGAAARITMTSTPALIGTADALDPNVHRGDFVAIARMKHTAVAATGMTAKARSLITGSGLGGTASVDSEPVISEAAAWRSVVFSERPLRIPAGNVPKLTGGSGYGPDIAQISQATGTAQTDLLDEVPYPYKVQTFTPEASFRATNYPLYLDIALNGATNLLLSLVVWKVVGGKLDTVVDSAQVYPEADVTNTNVDFVSLYSPTLEAGVTYALLPFIGYYSGPQPIVNLRLVTPSAYSGGSFGACSSRSAGATLTMDTDYDVRFAVYGRVPFDSSAKMQILASSAESNKYGYLDYVAILPTKGGAMIVERDTGAGDAGFLADFTPGPVQERDIYAYANDGTDEGVDPSVLTSALPLNGWPRLWPGDCAVLVDAETPGDAAPGGGLFRVRWNEVYLDLRGILPEPS